MSIWQRITSWWRKDEVAEAQAEPSMTQAERDVAEQDYESRKDDMSIPGSYVGGGGAGADFERDSERPGDSTP
jgi:hypothetical protein